MAPAPEEIVLDDALWARDPEYFARKILGIDTLWERQVEILTALRDHRRVAVPSCHESGKTFVASVAAAWWLLSHAPSKVITTAPTNRQVKDLLWSEIRARAFNVRNRLGEGAAAWGTPNQMDWRIPDVPQWFATGFASTADKASENASRLQGYHSPSMLVILDEAGGIQREVWAAVDSMLTSGTAKVLAIGQPQSGTEFERVCRSPDWRTMRISAFDCPNFRPGAKPMPWGVTPRWAEEMRRRWGEGSSVYQTKVLGMFPEAAVDTLLSLADVERAIARPALDWSKLPIGMGCDVARFGSDETVIYVVQGGRILHVESWAGQDTMKTAGAVLRLAKSFGIQRQDAHLIAIDDTGVGGGVTDRLREQEWYVEAVNFGSAPSRTLDEEKFVNRRMELWWNLRDWVKTIAALGDVPEDTKDALRADLVAPKYEQKSDGRIALEAKDKIGERVGRSPDHGDALALAVSAQFMTSRTGPSALPAPAQRVHEGHDDYDEADRRAGRPKDILSQVYGTGRWKW